jgi:5'-methylthioadenosine phosphorylase
MLAITTKDGRSMKIGIIGSLETKAWAILRDSERELIATEHGEVGVIRTHLDGTEVVGLIRGGGNAVAAHRLNHRANLAMLRNEGVDAIISTAMVGALSHRYPVGTIVILDQLLDFMHVTPRGFSQTGDYQEYDFTHPFDVNTRQSLILAAETLGLGQIEHRGCYVGVDGPRFETAAEVSMYGRLGGDVIGMTIVPEASMARELGIPYACVAGIVNLGAGLGEGEIEHASLVGERAAVVPIIETLVATALRVSVGIV